MLPSTTFDNISGTDEDIIKNAFRKVRSFKFVCMGLIIFGSLLFYSAISKGSNIYGAIIDLVIFILLGIGFFYSAVKYIELPIKAYLELKAEV